MNILREINVLKRVLPHYCDPISERHLQFKKNAVIYLLGKKGEILEYFRKNSLPK